MSTYPIDCPWDKPEWRQPKHRYIPLDEWHSGAVIEHVLGWEPFRDWRDFAVKYKSPLGSGCWLRTPTNVAVCQHPYPHWRIFDPGHEWILTFDPLHSRDDAQHIMDHIYQYKGPRLLRFAIELLHEPIEAIEGELPWLYWMDVTLRQWTPGQICRAAYEAVRPEQGEYHGLSATSPETAL